MIFSRRLGWWDEQNSLARAEERRRATGAPFADLTQSNPTLAVHDFDDAQDIAAALADPQLALYHPEPLGPRAAREAVARACSRPASCSPVAAEDVLLTASSSESTAYLWKLLCDPGDRVLVPQPSYPLFDYLARLEGVELRSYRLAYDGRWHVDWSSFDAQGCRAIVVVNPNNPTGSFLSRADWKSLIDRAAAAGAALVVDQVFADYPLDVPADGLLSVLDHPSPVLTFVLGGLSKSCALPQMKLGWTVLAGPPADRMQARRRWELIADTYLSVSGPVALATPRLLALGQRRRDRIHQRLRENLGLLRRTFAQSPCTVLPVEAGWSVILRVPATRSDEAWALELLESDGILVQPGYFFDLQGLGSTLVLSLLTDPRTLERALPALLARLSS